MWWLLKFAEAGFCGSLYQSHFSYEKRFQMTIASSGVSFCFFRDPSWVCSNERKLQNAGCGAYLLPCRISFGSEPFPLSLGRMNRVWTCFDTSIYTTDVFLWETRTTFLKLKKSVADFPFRWSYVYAYVWDRRTIMGNGNCGSITCCQNRSEQKWLRWCEQRGATNAPTNF